MNGANRARWGTLSADSFHTCHMTSSGNRLSLGSRLGPLITIGAEEGEEEVDMGGRFRFGRRGGRKGEARGKMVVGGKPGQAERIYLRGPSLTA